MRDKIYDVVEGEPVLRDPKPGELAPASGSALSLDKAQALYLKLAKQQREIQRLETLLEAEKQIVKSLQNAMDRMANVSNSDSTTNR